MNRENEKAMFASKKRLMNFKQNSKLLDEQLKKANYYPITPTIKGLNGKPLPVFYRQDYRDNILESNGVSPKDDPKIRSQGFLYKHQTGIPKLDKKMWYVIGGYNKDISNDDKVGIDDESSYLKQIVKNKSDLHTPERGHWLKQSSGIYWKEEDYDDDTRLVSGSLLTQNQLTRMYNNSVKPDEYETDNKLSPIVDNMLICVNCGNPKNSMGEHCKICGHR